MTLPSVNLFFGLTRSSFSAWSGARRRWSSSPLWRELPLLEAAGWLPAFAGAAGGEPWDGPLSVQEVVPP